MGEEKGGWNGNGGTKFYALMYADDMAIMAEYAGELRLILKSLEKYVKRAKMEVNVQKTKIMIFRKGGGEEERNGNY